MSGDWYVEIQERETGRVESRMGPESEHNAQKIARGASINLNHEEYRVVVIPPPCPHCGKPGDTEGSCGVGGCPLGLDT